MSLVSHKKDVDVMGLSLKNVRTHLIDHPRDEGLHRREQLWSFQQKYRGVVAGKIRQPLYQNDSEERKCDVNLEETPFDHSLLPSRFQRRFKRQQISLSTTRSNDIAAESGRQMKVSEEMKEDEKHSPGIQRRYSWGQIVKNKLYNQIQDLDDSNETKRTEICSENSKFLQAIQKHGSLENLPDITFPGTKAIAPQIRFMNSLNTFIHRSEEFQHADRQRMLIPRSLTDISDGGSRRRKLFIVQSSEHTDGNSLILGCLDARNENDEEDENNDGDNEEDECENDNRIKEARTYNDSDKKRPELITVRSNIILANTQDDMAILHRMHERARESLRSEKTFHVRNSECKKENSTDACIKAMDTPNISRNETLNDKCNDRMLEICNKSTPETRQIEKDKQNTKLLQGKETFKASEIMKDSDSDSSLDVPEDRFGPTTHSIDKKLAIRKPWEWRPSPYRWIDKPFVKESDKPYIERIINRGEIIDEFDYDSFARTKPVKVQNFPEGAGYRDRTGVMR